MRGAPHFIDVSDREEIADGMFDGFVGGEGLGAIVAAGIDLVSAETMQPIEAPAIMGRIIMTCRPS